MNYCFYSVAKACTKDLYDPVAFENVIALMCSERMSTRFSLRRNWEVDFVRFLLGYTTFDEEQSFNTLTMDHNKMCSNEHSITKKIGKAMTAVLRHGTKWNNIADKKEQSLW